MNFGPVQRVSSAVLLVLLLGTAATVAAPEPTAPEPTAPEDLDPDYWQAVIYPDEFDHSIFVGDVEVYDPIPDSTTTTSEPSTTTTEEESSVTSPVTTEPPSTSTSMAPSTTTTTAPPTTTTEPPPVGAAFFEDFSSSTAFDTRFVKDVGNYIGPNQERTHTLWQCCLWSDPAPEFIPGDHSHACEGPLTQRILDAKSPNVSQYFWHCAPNGPDSGHVMTAFDTSAYAVVSFSPNRTFTNITKVCWDINATEEGGGKWTNMVLVPENLYQWFAPRMDYVAPEFNEPNNPGDFNIQDHDHPGINVWGIKDFRGTQKAYLGRQELFYSGDVVHTTTDKATRFKHCVEEIPGNAVRLTVARPNGTTSTYIWTGQIPDGPMRVIFQDEMYDPPKRGGYNANNVTWHWDNVEVHER